MSDTSDSLSRALAEAMERSRAVVTLTLQGEHTTAGDLCDSDPDPVMLARAMAIHTVAITARLARLAGVPEGEVWRRYSTASAAVERGDDGFPRV